MEDKSFVQWGPFPAAAFESAVALVGNLTTQIEKMARLQLDASAETTREALTATQALADIKEVSELSGWQETYVQPGLERAVETARRQYVLLVESRHVVVEALKDASAEASVQIREGIDRLAEQAPEGYEPVFDVLRQGLDAQTAALESLTRVSEQLHDIAEANAVAFRDAVKPAVKTAPAGKRKAA